MLPHSKLITRDERFRQINKNFHKEKLVKKNCCCTHRTQKKTYWRGPFINDVQFLRENGGQ